MNVDNSFEFWMSNLPNSLLDIPLTELAIPGSHNSFSYGLNPQEPFAPDLDKSIASIANALSLFSPAIRETVGNWSKNQRLSVKEQLAAGIRYLDCRVAHHASSGRVRFVHGLWGPYVADELAHLVEFLDSHPKEIVFLDFNHFYQFDDDKHAIFTAELASLLSEYLIPFNEFTTNGTINWQNLTLSKLSKMSKHQLIVFYADETGVALSDLTFWPHSNIEAPWPNVQTSKDMIDFHMKKITDKTSTPTNGKFYVSQGVITPDGGLIMQNLTKKFYEHFAERVTVEFVQWLSLMAHASNRKMVTNLFIVDGVEFGGYVKTVLAFNLAKLTGESH